MKKLSYIFLLIFGVALLSSCEDESVTKGIEGSKNLAKFESYKINMGGLADGSEYDREVFIKVTGPSMENLTSDITVTIAANSMSTAEEGQHYRIANKTLTLSKSNNYLAIIDVVLVTEGNTPPMDGTPEFEDYVAPVLYLEIVSADGDASVIPTGKMSAITLNYRPPNPYAGLYDTEMRYFHPTAGGSHPSMGADFDPNDPYGGIRVDQKDLIAVTGRMCETGFAVWGDTDICWITINADNSINFVVDDTWPYDVKLGNPFDSSQVPHYDPDNSIIYLYYHYTGAGGDRIFWETFTATFK